MGRGGVAGSPARRKASSHAARYAATRVPSPLATPAAAMSTRPDKTLLTSSGASSPSHSYVLASAPALFVSLEHPSATSFSKRGDGGLGTRRRLTGDSSPSRPPSSLVLAGGLSARLRFVLEMTRGHLGVSDITADCSPQCHYRHMHAALRRRCCAPTVQVITRARTRARHQRT